MLDKNNINRERESTRKLIIDLIQSARIDTIEFFKLIQRGNFRSFFEVTSPPNDWLLYYRSIRSYITALNSDAMSAITLDPNAFRDPSPEFIKAVKNSLPLKFFFLVHIFCFLYYGEYPWSIYRRARQGSINDILALYRIDKSVVFDKLIANILHQHFQTSKHVPDDFLNSKIKMPSSKTIQARYAIFTMKILNAYGEKATYSELHEAMDHVEMIRAPENFNPDKTPDLQAFERAARRQHDFFDKSLKPDKSN